MVEFLLRHKAVQRGLDWNIGSAGLQASDGIPMHPSASRMLAREGLDTVGWWSRRANAELLVGSDLILTADQTQREAVVRLAPGVLGRTFTLLEFAYLAKFVRPSRRPGPGGFGPWVLVEARRTRDRVQPLRRSWRDVDDPMGKPAAQFKRCAEVIDRALEDMLVAGPEPTTAW